MNETMVGQTSGAMTVIAKAEKPREGAESVRGTWWLCRCDCGRTKILPRNYIKQGYVKSCGECRKVEKTVKKGKEKMKKKEAVRFCEKLAVDEKCERCGKTFGRTSRDWAYRTTKRNGKQVWFCSYGCMRAWQKEETGKRNV